MRVVLPYDPVWRALDWAKKNCPSYITNDTIVKKYPETGYDIVYFFRDEEDATIFALRWKTS